MLLYRTSCEQLLRLQPDDGDLTAALAGAYLLEGYYLLALRTFRRFLERHPDHEKSGQARLAVRKLQSTLPEVIRQAGLEGEAGMALAEQHEEVRNLLEQGRYPEARSAAEQLLKQKPDFAPVLNNLSQIEAMQGKLDQAISAAERVLAVDAANIHALANLTRYCLLADRRAEADAYAQRLKASNAPATDRAVKIAEALISLGDDEGVLDNFRRASKVEKENPYLLHLTAVAAMRLDKVKEARRYWKKALDLNPGLASARLNLEDLSLPPGERNGQGPFPDP